MKSALSGPNISEPAQRHSVTRLCTGALLLTALSACGPAVQPSNEFEDLVERQSLYRNLAGLEEGLRDGALAGLSPAEEISAESVIRRPFAISPAQFEISRNRRVLALEQLASLTAPEDDADDYDDFWEIHQAYRYAVETGLAGHGKIGLVYSRPYSADHLSNPMLVLQDMLDGVTGRVLPADAEDLAEAFRNTTRRLDLDLAAGIAPPLSVIRRMQDQVDLSPFTDDAGFAGYVASFNAVQPNETAVFDTGIQALLTPDMQKEVRLYRDTLDRIRLQFAQPSPPAGLDPKFADAILRQATSGELTASTCYQAARREGIAVEAVLLDLLAPADSETVASETLTHKTLAEHFSGWPNGAPLFLPEADGTTTTPPRQTETDGTIPTPVSPSFQLYSDALGRLKTEWTTLFDRSFLPSVYSETGFTGASLPKRIEPTRLQYDPLTVEGTPRQRMIRFQTLAFYPVSQAVIDTLLDDFPGRALASAAKENREDRPLLSRKLPNLAFDLGWPDYAVSLMAARGAFDEAPQLNVARMYRVLQVTSEAQIEAGLITGDMSPEDAASLLKDRFGLSDAQIADILDRLHVEPGLACGRLAGFRKFLSLKARAEGVLGDRFNIREFNDVILSPGSRPLQIVEADTDSWIARNAGLMAAETDPG